MLIAKCNVAAARLAGINSQGEMRKVLSLVRSSIELEKELTLQFFVLKER